MQQQVSSQKIVNASTIQNEECKIFVPHRPNAEWIVMTVQFNFTTVVLQLEILIVITDK